MSESTNLLENSDILQLSQKHLIFEINIAKEIEILITSKFYVCNLVSRGRYKVFGNNFCERTHLFCNPCAHAFTRSSLNWPGSRCLRT